MFSSIRAISLIGSAALFAGLAGGAAAQANKPKPGGQKPNTVKGQGQLAGANGQFGTVYSLKNNFNFAVLGGRYSLDPFDAYVAAVAKTEEKVVVLDIAVKNVQKEDSFLDIDRFLTLVDQDGKLYEVGTIALKSKGASVADWTLKAGQGLGQAELKDPLQVAAVVPAKARIVKVIVNKGRIGTSEDVLRYYVAGATKAEAGEAGDPKNIIAQLPEGVKDPADKTGTTPLETGKGAMGVAYPSGRFTITLDSFAYSTAPHVPDVELEEGKKYAIATVTAKNVTSILQTVFDVIGGDPLHEILDSDGERIKPVAFLKTNRLELADSEIKSGQQYTLRIVFSIPKDGTAKQLVLACGESRKWAFDVSGVK